MKRWLPAPRLSVGLFFIWLFLNQTIAPGHILLALFLALAIPVVTAPLRPAYPVVKRFGALFRLLGYALIEIVRSCFNVSRIILFSHTKDLNSQFIKIPLDMDNPTGLAILSCLINTTPGTVWVEFLEDSNELSLHVFDLHDANWWVNTIKTRYEQPILEIFK